MKYIKLGDIKIDENQPRTTFNENELNNLAISIKEIGILQTILITSDNTIIGGERRYRASKIANLENIPCYTIQSLPNNQIELAQIIANTNRSDLTGLEIAKAVKKILETGLDKKDDGNNSLDNDNLIDNINKKFRKIKLNKNQLKDVIDFINENEQIEIILNNKLADDIENLIN